MTNELSKLFNFKDKNQTPFTLLTEPLHWVLTLSGLGFLKRLGVGWGENGPL